MFDDYPDLERDVYNFAPENKRDWNVYKMTFYFVIALAIITYIGCNLLFAKSNKEKARQPETGFTDFKQVPAHFRRYLDSVYEGKFLIANPGERWASACTRVAGEPDKQLISAVVSGDTLRMSYWQSQGPISPEES